MTSVSLYGLAAARISLEELSESSPDNIRLAWVVRAGVDLFFDHLLQIVVNTNAELFCHVPVLPSNTNKYMAISPPSVLRCHICTTITKMQHVQHESNAGE